MQKNILKSDHSFNEARAIEACWRTEILHNRERLHGTPGHRSPVDFETVIKSSAAYWGNEQA
jgi:hypothetical protein